MQFFAVGEKAGNLNISKAHTEILMTRYYCQDHPFEFNVQAKVVTTEPGRLLLDRSPFFPGGGGQLADRGVLVGDAGSATVSGVEIATDGVWHFIETPFNNPDTVEIRVDEYHRNLQSELHTLAHIINAVVFKAFDGALLTGAQLNDNGTLRIDFDLPGVDNDRLRALEAPINEAAQADHQVTTHWMSWYEAEAEPGLFRAKFAAPPKGEDGMVRIVQIGELDRQACGGTHVASTASCRPVRIMKIENKGRQNRRLRVGIAEMI